MALDSGNIITMCLGMMRQGVEDLPEAQQREATQLLDELNTIFSGNVIPGGDERIAPSTQNNSLLDTSELEDTSEIGPGHQSTLCNDENRVRVSSMQQMSLQTHGQPQISCISTDTHAISPHDSAGDTQQTVSMLSLASSGCENTPSVGIPPWSNFTLQGQFFEPTNGGWAPNTTAESFPGFDPSSLGPQSSVNPYIQATALTQPPFSTMDNSTRTSGGWNGYSIS